LLLVAGCEAPQTAVVCWEEPVGPVRTSSVSYDRYLPKHAQDVRVVCAPIHARPVGKPIIYSGPGGSAPGAVAPGPLQPPAPPPAKPPAQEKVEGLAARVTEDEVSAYDPRVGFAIVKDDNVIAGDLQGVTNLNEIVSNLFDNN